jgi:tRNA wybutosine-synthesizing protein 1
LKPLIGDISLLDSVSSDLIRLLERQKYHLVGSHSAVKRCRWLYESLVHNRPCYKQKFYGIKSHQCIQMTPALHYCTMRCLFCWRAQSGDLSHLIWDEQTAPNWDDPEQIVETSIKTQIKLVSGYMGNPKTDRIKVLESLRPKHVAISLAGEPTLYPQLGELIHEFKKRSFTTFLVSNGTVPEALAKLSEEPTQLYVSLCAYDEQCFKKTCRPQEARAWEKLNQTLAALPSFKCPTVLRLTLARHLNLERPELYAKLVEKANPTYVEPKAYMHVGFSRLRLSFENMPSHQEIRTFAEQLAHELSYKILDEASDSRVVLLSRLEKPIRLA